MEFFKKSGNYSFHRRCGVVCSSCLGICACSFSASSFHSFENTQVIVVEKPTGIVTHPDAVHRRYFAPKGFGTDFACAKGLPMRPGVVHRLDKETSGVVIFAKTDEALLSLQKLFAERNVRKIYRTTCARCSYCRAGDYQFSYRSRYSFSKKCRFLLKKRRNMLFLILRFCKDFIRLRNFRFALRQDEHIKFVFIFLLLGIRFGDSVYGSRKCDIEIARLLKTLFRVVYSMQNLFLLFFRGRKERTFILHFLRIFGSTFRAFRNRTNSDLRRRANVCERTSVTLWSSSNTRGAPKATKMTNFSPFFFWEQFHQISFNSLGVFRFCYTKKPSRSF